MWWAKSIVPCWQSGPFILFQNRCATDIYINVLNHTVVHIAFSIRLQKKIQMNVWEKREENYKRWRWCSGKGGQQWCSFFHKNNYLLSLATWLWWWTNASWYCFCINKQKYVFKAAEVTIGSAFAEEIYFNSSDYFYVLLHTGQEWHDVHSRNLCKFLHFFLN